MEPLYGHTSQDTAYLVHDYPYGSARCRIRYWIEHSETRGYRFASQTENPYSLRWNKPKYSTYAEFAACMYLDDRRHVQCARVHRYTSVADTLEFVRRFPLASRDLLPLATARIKLAQAMLERKAQWVINDEPVPRTEADDKRERDELAQWREIVDLVRDGQQIK